MPVRDLQTNVFLPYSCYYRLSAMVCGPVFKREPIFALQKASLSFRTRENKGSLPCGVCLFFYCRGWGDGLLFVTVCQGGGSAQARIKEIRGW